MADRVLLSGNVRGPALVLDEPLSMWGGLDPATGEIIDRRHPQAGEIATGRVLVMPAGRGSSSSSSVLAEAIRCGSGPAAVVLAELDDIVLLGALVAEELYGIICPVVIADATAYGRVRSGDLVTITPDGMTIEETSDA